MMELALLTEVINNFMFIFVVENSAITFLVARLTVHVLNILVMLLQVGSIYQLYSHILEEFYRCKSFLKCNLQCSFLMALFCSGI